LQNYNAVFFQDRARRTVAGFITYRELDDALRLADNAQTDLSHQHDGCRAQGKGVAKTGTEDNAPMVRQADLDSRGE
jgi:hypothetical protein